MKPIYALKQNIGRAMLAAPFVGLAVFGAASIGLWQTILIFAGIAAFVVWLWIAVELSA
jgi:hypothetical protein